MTLAAAAIGTTYEVEQVDSSGDWTFIGEVLSLSGPEITSEEVDVSSLDSTGGYKEFIAALRDAGSVSIECNWINSQPQQWLRDLVSTAQTAKQHKISFADGTVAKYTAIVTACSFSAEPGAQIKATFTIKLRSAPAWDELVAPQWALLTNLTDDPTNRGISADGVLENRGVYAGLLVDPDGTDGAMIFCSGSEPRYWEKAGLSVAPQRTYLLNGSTNPNAASWLAALVTKSVDVNVPSPVSGFDAGGVITTAATGTFTLAQWTAAASLVSGQRTRVVFSTMVKADAAGTAIESIVLQVGNIALSSYGRAFFNHKTKVANFVAPVQAGNCTVVDSYFMAAEYVGFVRAVLVVDFEATHTDTQMSCGIMLKDNSTNNSITATFAAGQVLPIYYTQAEISGIKVGSAYTLDWGRYPARFVTQVGTINSERYRWPYNPAAAAVGFRETFNPGAIYNEDPTGTQDLQARGAYYVEVTPMANGIRFGGNNPFDADNFAYGLQSAILEADDTNDASADGIYDNLDSWRSKYLQHIADPANLWNSYGNIYTKGANTNNPPHSDIGNYATVPEGSYMFQEGQTARICVVYDSELKAYGTGAGGYQKIFINGIKVFEKLSTFSTWGNGCNGKFFLGGNDWSAPGPLNGLGLKIGDNNGTGLGQTSRVLGMNIKNLSWWNEPLSDALAAQITASGFKASDI